VLDADGMHVEPVVAGLVRDVLGMDELGDLTVGGPDQVVRRDSGVRVLEPGDGSVVALLGVMDDDVTDVIAVAWPVGLVVVAVRGRPGRVGPGVSGRDETAVQPGWTLRLIGHLHCTRWLGDGRLSSKHGGGQHHRSPQQGGGESTSENSDVPRNTANGRIPGGTI
jgi:hypothetical protein